MSGYAGFFETLKNPGLVVNSHHMYKSEITCERNIVHSQHILPRREQANSKGLAEDGAEEGIG